MRETEEGHQALEKSTNTSVNNDLGIIHHEAWEIIIFSTMLCKICANDYVVTSPDDPHTPVVGACGHGCCRACVESMLHQSWEKTGNYRLKFVKCPFCSKPQAFHIDRLCVNYTLMSLLEEQQQQQQQQQQQLGVATPARRSSHDELEQPIPAQPQAVSGMNGSREDPIETPSRNSEEFPSDGPASRVLRNRSSRSRGHQDEELVHEPLAQVPLASFDTRSLSEEPTTDTPTGDEEAPSVGPARNLRRSHRLVNPENNAGTGNVPRRSRSRHGIPTANTVNQDSRDRRRKGPENGSSASSTHERNNNERASSNNSSRPATRFRAQRSIRRTNEMEEERPLREGMRESADSHNMDRSSSKRKRDSEEEEEKEEEEEENTTRGHVEVPAIKTETKHYLRAQANVSRRYGDRSLLSRQSPRGLMKLGGPNAGMNLYPGKKNINHPRFQAPVIGYDKARAYTDLWNPSGPKWAGMETASVGDYPPDLEEGESFAVFMKRTLNNSTEFGWEYCGHYRLIDPEMVFFSAHALSDGAKAKMVHDIVESIKRPQRYWISRVAKWRAKLTSALEIDHSEPGPPWMVEGRIPTYEETTVQRDADDRPIVYSLAARARALGFHPHVPGEELAKIMVQLDEFHGETTIRFVEYKEEMYDFVKDGETSRNAQGKPRKNGEPCAKASDWYSCLDQHIL